MPDITVTTPGAPCWLELTTSDPARSQEFYGALFGWDAEIGDDVLYGGYVSFNLSGRRIAGAMKKQGDAHYPDSWSVYLLTTDAAATAAAVAEAGGENMFAPMDVPNMGVMGFATDATGATVGYWKPAEHTGFQVEREHGAPVWCELLASDFEKAVTFYEKAFGWSLKDEGTSDDFRYKTFEVDGQAFAGIYDAKGDLAEGEPASWAVYFGADDVDATVAKAVELGATVKDPAVDTEYGRIASVTDPTGAVLRLMSF
ncbi:VOC family protein [Mycetocola zhujimingii]|uniref:VOC family protein n=1 Tax=Mycetocola zhujimingii TaxID=2079792 RepID=UPI000D344942|nr:VOC family protein [Mycetocola zhujimingii]AWB87704.1 glyoxalase [Mycetocola zhujimingii]